MHVNQHHFAELGSTQNRARELIHAHYELPLLVTAKMQTAGRGRMGREWVSPPGNFYGSIALRAPVEPARYHEYSFLAALILRDTIIQSTDQTVTLKWPNDILLDGKKCAGILIESDGIENEFLIIGIGVNLYHAPTDTIYPATALWPDAAFDAARNAEFTARLSENFMSWHARYLSDGFEILRTAWLQHVHGLDGEITVKTPVAEMSGTFTGLDADGSLLLTRDGQETKVMAADVRII